MKLQREEPSDNRQETFKRSYVRAENGCWNWTGLKYLSGYGRFAQGYAHRYAYRRYLGEIPQEMCVCHRCDNPSCVNPDHLWLGTMMENIRDRDRKGRGRPGVPQKKLTLSQEFEIKRKYVPRNQILGARALAKRYNISASTVLAIVARR